MLCRLWVAFSAMHSAQRRGSRKFSSEGASVPGVSWNRSSTPSTVSSCPVRLISTVGATRPGRPLEVVKPRPIPSSPVASRSSAPPA